MLILNGVLLTEASIVLLSDGENTVNPAALPASQAAADRGATSVLAQVLDGNVASIRRIEAAGWVFAMVTGRPATVPSISVPCAAPRNRKPWRWRWPLP